ncbi:MAG: hypothetical protein LBM62_05265 [Mediterranea sp.]|nr:hypothetical protein [Mediterranea sp.]
MGRYPSVTPSARHLPSKEGEEFEILLLPYTQILLPPYTQLPLAYPLGLRTAFL